MESPAIKNTIPATLQDPAAKKFWSALLATGAVAGLGAALLTRLLEVCQRLLWGGSGTDILAAAQNVNASRRLLILLAAGLVTGLGQIVLKKLSSGNGIDTTAAIWFHAGRLPMLRTLGSAVLSVVVVGMGASLGREGAPKQVGAVFANWFSDRARLSDEQRRLLVSCGAGAGMSAAYGVPLGGALFSLEVMRGVLALRYILPALFCSITASAVAWTMLPDAPTYNIPAFASSFALVPAVLCGLAGGLFSVAYVRLMTWAERNKPTNWRRVVVPIVGLGLLGIGAIWFPQLLGNGKDVSQLMFLAQVPAVLAMELFILKPAAILLCVRSGVPGGLFTPSLTSGALLGTVIGYLCTWLWPGAPLGLFGLLGAGAVLAATTQGPISAVVLLMELTGRDRSFILPLLLAAATATLIARSIEARSIYDARLSDEEIRTRQELRQTTRIEPDRVG
jgi:H+/Cl- antiporter ClcA